MKWRIDKLAVRPKEANFENVVTTAFWTCFDEDNESLGTLSGKADFKISPESDFVEFIDLSEEQILEWVWNSGVEKEAVESSVAQEVIRQKTGVLITPQLPWTIAQD